MMGPEQTQVTVLAGGLATRLGDAARSCPKVLQPVGGQPFLDIMLRPLLDQGFRRFCFCLGHLADQVVAHLRDQERHRLDTTFHVDTSPLGTAGSLIAARPLLDDVFVVVLGDTYFDIDYADLLDHLTDDAWGVMAVTDNVVDVPGNVECRGNRVVRYDRALGHRTRWVDCGTLVLRRQALDLLQGSVPPVDLSLLFDAMIERDVLRAYQVGQRFYDIGTRQRLDRFAEWLATDPVTDRGPRRPQAG